MNRRQVSAKCIIFFGPDGSGKTVHTRLLQHFLVENGYKVHIIRIRANHTISFLLLSVLQRIGFINVNVLFEGFDERLASKLKTIWPLVEYASVVPLVLLKVYLPLQLRRLVICERYVVDTIVAVRFLFNNPSPKIGFTERALLALIPKRAAVFYLVADEKLLLKRRQNEPVTSRFIKFQTAMYDSFAERLDTVLIDTSHIEKKAVNRIIKSRLGIVNDVHDKECQAVTK